MDKKTILYVGRLSTEKGVKYLVRAMNYFNQERVKLEIVGRGPKLLELREYVKKNSLEGNVTFHGHLPHEKLPKIYARADVFVLPSIVKENSPLTPLEAMAMQTPVITTNYGGQAELVEDGFNGFLTPPKNSKEMADKIKILLNNPSLQKKMGERGESLVYQYFTPERHKRDLFGTIRISKP